MVTAQTRKSWAPRAGVTVSGGGWDSALGSLERWGRLRKAGPGPECGVAGSQAQTTGTWALVPRTPGSGAVD